MKKIILSLLFAATGAGLLAQSEPPADRPMPNGIGIGLFNKRVDVSTLPQELQDLVNQFRDQRAQFLADRKAMFEQLKGMTEQERRQALEQLRTQLQDQLQEQRQLAKQIREELRTLREQRRQDSGG